MAKSISVAKDPRVRLTDGRGLSDGNQLSILSSLNLEELFTFWKTLKKITKNAF